jgi:YbbR domain-containing protein
MRDWVTKDFGWKLFSLFLAVAIWLTVHKIYEEPNFYSASGVETTYRNLPLQVISANGDVHEYRVSPDTVAVTVKGPVKVMEVLQARQIRAKVDVTDIKSAHGRLPVDVNTPPGVTLINVDPPEVDVTAPPPPDKKP